MPDIQNIIGIELQKVSKRLAEKGLKLVLSDEARDFIIEEGYSPDYGARPLRRAIERLLEDPLAEDLLRGTFQGKDTILVKATQEDGKKRLFFETSKAEELVPAGA
jgi:ATP-dependent Clp protease ATP-binding subunit ClpC